MHTIYGLVDPRTFMIRYIGISRNHPSVRLIEHLERKSRADKKNLWLDGLKALNLKPALVILDFAPDLESAKEKECWWIRHGITNGWELTNAAHTQEPKRQLRSACNGRVPHAHSEPSEPGPTDLQAQAFAWMDANPDGTQTEMREALGISKGYASRLWREYHGG